jgi:hypothetical protein
VIDAGALASVRKRHRRKDALMTDFSNVRTENLKRWRTTLALQRSALDVVAQESDRLSSEAQMELARVRRWLRIDHETIEAVLAERDRMKTADRGTEDRRVA